MLKVFITPIIIFEYHLSAAAFHSDHHFHRTKYGHCWDDKIFYVIPNIHSKNSIQFTLYCHIDSKHQTDAQKNNQQYLEFFKHELGNNFWISSTVNTICIIRKQSLQHKTLIHINSMRKIYGSWKVFRKKPENKAL